MISTLSPEHIAPSDANDPALPHVLLVLDQIPKSLGGGERIVLRLAALLPQYGYRVSILSFSAHPDSPALQSPPCPVYLLPLKRTYDIHALRAAFTFRDFIRQHQIRIVQTFFESSDLWAGWITKMMTPARLIWSRRDMGILRTRKHRIGYRLMASLPDAVFAVSEKVRQHCINQDGLPPDRVLTIYNGIDLSDWKISAGNPEISRRPHITTLGNIRRVKGHDIFIAAAALIVARYDDARFSIAGDVLEAEYYSELQALIRNLNLSGHVHFTGGVTDIREHLAGADIFVLPSRSEGFSNAIVEAMAASLPVVATNVGGNAEAVIDSVSGFLVPPEDPVALSAAITRLLSDPHQARAMGTAGRALVKEKFTTEVMMNQIVSAYRNILSGR
jgi:glycosyltransferase involved in cell wall biosynthesis